MLRSWRGNNMTPSPAGILSHLPAEFSGQTLCLFLGMEIADRLRWVFKSRIVRIDLDLCQQTNNVPRIVGRAQDILERLHEQISDAALRVGDANIERHRLNAMAGYDLPQQDLAYYGSVAMGDDQFGVEKHQRQQGVGKLRGHLHLLVGRTPDSFGVCRVSADRDDEA